MLSTRGIRLGLATCLLGIAGLGAGVSFLPAASGATGPHLFVTPSTKLHNGENVKIKGSGFKPGDTVYVVECLAHAKGQAQCNSLGATPVTVTATGLIATFSFKVITGKIASGTCGTTAKNLSGCQMSAGNIMGGDTASTPITFASPAK